MSTFRHLIWLASLAIFGATILLGPTETKAHAGHKHHAVISTSEATQNVLSAATSRTLSELPANAIELLKSTPVLVIEVVIRTDGKANAESVRSQNPFSESHGCVSGCCDDCMACCGIAYNLGSSNLLYSARFARVSLPSLADPQRHDPEAVRKPPRSVV